MAELRRYTAAMTPLRALTLACLLAVPALAGALAAVVGPVFDRIAGSLVDAFVKRAEHVYG